MDFLKYGMDFNKCGVDTHSLPRIYNMYMIISWKQMKSYEISWRKMRKDEERMRKDEFSVVFRFSVIFCFDVLVSLNTIWQNWLQMIISGGLDKPLHDREVHVSFIIFSKVLSPPAVRLFVG